MHNFTYSSPTRLLFGKDTIPGLVAELQAAAISRVLILTGGPSVQASGLYGTVCSLLHTADIHTHSVSGVQPNPRLSKVREAIAQAKAVQAEAIIPLGGGSVFDSAKAVAAGAASEHDIWDSILGRQPVKTALPIYGILTLSGTSSEINNTGVITNEETHEKFPFVSDLVYPKVSIVDPTLQYTVPLQQIRHSGLDALTHVLEAYVTGMDTSMVIVEHGEAFARGIIRCLRALPQAREDYAVRSELAFCSAYAHSGWASIGRSSRGDFSSHRIALALSALFDIPHGVTLGIIMPAWMEYIYARGLAHNTFRRFTTHIMGIEQYPDKRNALAGIKAFKEFVRSLDMPVSLSEVDITEKDIPALAENAIRTLPFGCVQAMDLVSVKAILKLAL